MWGPYAESYRISVVGGVEYALLILGVAEL